MFFGPSSNLIHPEKRLSFGTAKIIATSGTYFQHIYDYHVWTIMLSIMKPDAPVGIGKSIAIRLNGCPAEFRVNVPSG